MQSAVSEATGFVHYARAARFFPLVRFGIKVSEPVRQSGRGRGSPGWIVCAARACMERGSAMEAGLREAALAAPQGTARRGRRGERVCGGRSCRPARHSPKGQCRGRGARRGHAWRGSAPWKRACGRCFCRPARHSPKGQCRGERVRGTACMGGEARRGSGLAEAALAAPQGTARRGSAGNHRLQSGGSPAGRPPFAACADIMRRTKQKSGALSPCRQKKP